ncbi:MAG: hypothetical protein ACYC2R_09235 [Burkholderiales bacterium]
MLIDTLDRAARERLEAISIHVAGMGIPLAQKLAIEVNLTSVQDLIGTLCIHDLQFLNKVLTNILNMLNAPGAALEPLTWLLTNLLKLLGSSGDGHDPKIENLPRLGLERARGV